MDISIIAAMAENRVIGRSGAIPWDLPEDRRRFRSLTMGHPVIMGRMTFEAIGHPLPGRKNIVLSRQAGFSPDGCLVLHDLRAALRVCAGSSEVFICGGGEVYCEALPLVKRIYLTIVHAEVEGDTRFPEYSSDDFTELDRQEVGGTPPSTLLVLERKRPPRDWRKLLLSEGP